MSLKFNQSDYRDLLKDDRWQHRRLDIFYLRGKYCSNCKKKGTHKDSLNIHHIKHTGLPWEAPDDDLICLCKDCHKNVHFHPEIFSNEDCIKIIEEYKIDIANHGEVGKRIGEIELIILSHIEKDKIYNKVKLFNSLKKYYQHIKLDVSYTLSEFCKEIEYYIKIENVDKDKIVFSYYEDEELIEFFTDDLEQAKKDRENYKLLEVK